VHLNVFQIALQAGFFKRLFWRSGFILSQFFSVSSCDHIKTPWWWEQISVWSTGCCQTTCSYKHLTGLLQLLAKGMFGYVNWYFLLTHYSKICILLAFLCENSNVYAIRHLYSTVCMHGRMDGWMVGYMKGCTICMYTVYAFMEVYVWMEARMCVCINGRMYVFMEECM